MSVDQIIINKSVCFITKGTLKVKAPTKLACFDCFSIINTAFIEIGKFINYFLKTETI